MQSTLTKNNSSIHKAVKFRFEYIAIIGLATCAMVSVLTTFGIIGTLVYEAASFFKHISLSEFLLGISWSPQFEPRSFGVLPLLAGTFLVSVVAGMISMPTGLLIAIFLSEFASKKVRSILKPCIELLAGIPSVVFGFFAMATVTPFLQSIIPSIEVFNALSAAVVVAIMTIPLVASMSDDAIHSVSSALKSGGYALGATKSEVIRFIVLPAASSGIFASFILAFSRAIGETMAVAMAAGATPNLTLNPLASIQTMTAYIAQVSMGDTPHGTVEYQTIFAVGLLLFLITFVTNILANYTLKRIKTK